MVDRLYNVIAAEYEPLKDSDRVRIFEIGGGYDGISRVSEVNKMNGEEDVDLTAINCRDNPNIKDTLTKSNINAIKNYLTISLLARRYVMRRMLGIPEKRVMLKK